MIYGRKSPLQTPPYSPTLHSRSKRTSNCCGSRRPLIRKMCAPANYFDDYDGYEDDDPMSTSPRIYVFLNDPEVGGLTGPDGWWFSWPVCCWLSARVGLQIGGLPVSIYSYGYILSVEFIILFIYFFLLLSVFFFVLLIALTRSSIINKKAITLDE